MFSSMPLAWGVGRWIKAGRVIALDVMWARQQPALKRATAAVQVWVARGDCVGTLEVQVSVAGSGRATG